MTAKKATARLNLAREGRRGIHTLMPSHPKIPKQGGRRVGGDTLAQMPCTVAHGLQDMLNGQWGKYSREDYRTLRVKHICPCISQPPKASHFVFHKFTLHCRLSVTRKKSKDGKYVSH